MRQFQLNWINSAFPEANSLLPYFPSWSTKQQNSNVYNTASCIICSSLTPTELHFAVDQDPVIVFHWFPLSSVLKLRRLASRDTPSSRFLRAERMNGVYPVSRGSANVCTCHAFNKSQRDMTNYRWIIASRSCHSSTHQELSCSDSDSDASFL